MANRGIYYNKSGTWVPVEQPFVNVSDERLPVLNGYVKVNGVWEQFYPQSGSQQFTTPGQFTFVVPPGISKMTVNITAGGGGGGGGSTASNGSGGAGGGSGGEYSNHIMYVVPNETLTLVVGSGGAGAVASGTNISSIPLQTIAGILSHENAYTITAELAVMGGTGGDSSINGSMDSVLCTGGGGGANGEVAASVGAVSAGTAGYPDGLAGGAANTGQSSVGGTGASGYYGTGGAGGSGTNASAATGGNAAGYGAGGGGAGCVPASPYTWAGGAGTGGYIELLWGPGVDPNY